MLPASACSAPDRIAISVLLPAPFWPTIAHTSPGATATSTPSTATVAPNALRMPRISKRGVAVTLFPLEPAVEVRLQQRLRLGCVHVVMRHDANASIDASLHGLALKLRDDGLDAEIPHVHRVLDDQPVDESVAER